MVTPPPDVVAERSRLREVDAWLVGIVGGKRVPVSEIQRQAAERGYHWSKVKRAKKRINAESEKGSWTDPWVWHLPIPR